MWGDKLIAKKNKICTYTMLNNYKFTYLHITHSSLIFINLIHCKKQQIS